MNLAESLQPHVGKYEHGRYMRWILINGSQPDIKTGEGGTLDATGGLLPSMPHLSIKAKTEPALPLN